MPLRRPLADALHMFNCHPRRTDEDTEVSGRQGEGHRTASKQSSQDLNLVLTSK